MNKEKFLDKVFAMKSNLSYIKKASENLTQIIGDGGQLKVVPTEGNEEEFNSSWLDTCSVYLNLNKNKILGDSNAKNIFLNKFVNKDFSNVEFDGFNFSNMTFSNEDIHSNNLTDCNFTNCNLTNVHFYGLEFGKVKIKNCEVNNCVIRDCQIDDLDFVNCINTENMLFDGNIYSDEVILFVNCDEPKSLIKDCPEHYVQCPNCHEVTRDDDLMHASTKTRFGKLPIGCDKCAVKCCRCDKLLSILDADRDDNGDIIIGSRDYQLIVDGVFKVYGDYYCEDCFGETYTNCTDCQDLLAWEDGDIYFEEDDDGNQIGDEVLCEHCANNRKRREKEEREERERNEEESNEDEEGDDEDE